VPPVIILFPGKTLSHTISPGFPAFLEEHDPPAPACFLRPAGISMPSPAARRTCSKKLGATNRAAKKRKAPRANPGNPGFMAGIIPKGTGGFRQWTAADARGFLSPCRPAGIPDDGPNA